MNNTPNKPVETTPANKPVKVKRFKVTRKMKDEIADNLGLIKVRGAVSGKVYYE